MSFDNAIVPTPHFADDRPVEILIFGLGDEAFAFEAAEVTEIVEPQPETRVPRSPPLVGSIINYRGRIIPLADLRAAFRQPDAAPTEDSRIVIVELTLQGHVGLIGVKADRVIEVRTVARREIEPVPDEGTDWKPEYLRGLVRIDDAPVFLPNVANILRAFCSFATLSIRTRNEASP